MSKAFEKKFAAERAKGSKVFTFGGKSYNTKLKSEGSKSSLPKKTPVIPSDGAVARMQKTISDNASLASASGITRRRGDLTPTQQQGRMSGASDGVRQPSGPSTRGSGNPAKYNSSTSNNSSMGDGVTSIPSPEKSHSFFKHTEVNRSARNDFRQSESKRAADYSVGKANAPKVKRAIGKFMLGKGYKD